MNWTLLFIAFTTLIIGISARPTEDDVTVVVAAAAQASESTTSKVIIETTNLTERSSAVTESSALLASIEEATTKKPTKIAEKISTNAATTTQQIPTTIRYLTSQKLQTDTKSTNASQRKKYANNYSNLITKHTLHNKRFVNNTASNITVVPNHSYNDNINHDFIVSSSISDRSSESNEIINYKSNNKININVETTMSNEGVSLPFVTISSATNSNSSSKPLVFVDADHIHHLAQQLYNDPTTTSTTRRAFIALNGVPLSAFQTNNVEGTKATNLLTTTTRKKPIIHKIISKWSDNPNEVFNFHGDGDPIISSQQAQINELKNQLVQQAFNNHHTSVTSFDNLPTIIGQQLLHQQQHMSTIQPVPTFAPSPVPTKSNLLAIKRKPPVVINDNVSDSIKRYDKCKDIKIKFGTTYNGKLDSEEEEDCKGLNIHIDNKIDNTNVQSSTSDYDNSIYDKYVDHATEEVFDASENFVEIETEVANSHVTRPGSLKGDGGGKKKRKNKNKKKKKIVKQGILGSQFEEEEGEEEVTTIIEEEGGQMTDMGSVIMTVMTMMAVFNPLNFGLWGILLAPVAALTLGGICFAMYQLMQTQNKRHQVWHAPSQPYSWQKPHEIIVKNKINHSPIPIKITHLHKHTTAPQKLVYAQHHTTAPQKVYGNAPIPHTSSVIEYAPPWQSAPAKPQHQQPIQTSYGEPPADSYFPSAPTGNGPYRRKQIMQRKRRPNPFRYKLL